MKILPKSKTEIRNAIESKWNEMEQWN